MANKFSETYNNAIEEIANHYENGYLAWLRKSSPQLSKKELLMDQKINALWNKDLRKFEEAVSEWKAVYIKGLVEFHRAQHPSFFE